jgi:hypothetical protein
LRLEVVPEKTILLPGEPVTMTFIVTNQSASPFKTHEINIGRGDIQLLSSYESGPYKRYRGDWGFVDTLRGELTLGPGEQMTEEATVHFNHVRFNTVETHYAFPNPGTYTLKATFDYGINRQQLVEGGPIQLHVKEPKGADAAVWARIKEDRDVAYFIYERGGAFVDSDGTPGRIQGERVVRTLHEILSKHPNSTYTAYIEPALANYHNNLARWKVARVQMAEGTIVQAGQIMRKGDRNRALKMLQNADNIFQENGLFSKAVPLEGYIGLMHVMQRDYAKGLEYLEPLTTTLLSEPGTRIIREAAAFAHLGMGKDDRAFQLIQTTRPETERGLVLKRFREQVRAGERFTLEFYQ